MEARLKEMYVMIHVLFQCMKRLRSGHSGKDQKFSLQLVFAVKFSPLVPKTITVVITTEMKCC